MPCMLYTHHIFPSLEDHLSCHTNPTPQARLTWTLKATEEVTQTNSSDRTCRVDCDYGIDGESENDLAEMVHDFIENGSCEDGYETRPADAASSIFLKLSEALQAVSTTIHSSEREVESIVASIISAANESDLSCSTNGGDCKGNCVRQFAVRHLRLSGYNASVCKSNWPNSTRVPGGKYEYVDICLGRESILNERLIIDFDFQSQFEIARPSQHYKSALRSLPVVFVGKSSKLEQILQIMSEAAKRSLKQNSMYLPPWRTLAYMHAKWFSPYERKGTDSRDQQLQLHREGVNWGNYDRLPVPLAESQCRQQLRRLKAAMKVHMDEGLYSEAYAWQLADR